MTTNDELDSNLLKLFSNFKDKGPEKDYLIEQIGENDLTVIETQKGGEGEVTFKNSYFLRFSNK